MKKVLPPGALFNTPQSGVYHTAPSGRYIIMAALPPIHDGMAVNSWRNASIHARMCNSCAAFAALFSPPQGGICLNKAFPFEGKVSAKLTDEVAKHGKL
ncbi:MAG: hypothetical protein II736_01895 [Clostridia bacterium]|nr:hypothetical protein [Clostridia bacterium]